MSEAKDWKEEATRRVHTGRLCLVAALEVELFAREHGVAFVNARWDNGIVVSFDEGTTYVTHTEFAGQRQTTDELREWIEQASRAVAEDEGAE